MEAFSIEDHSAILARAGDLAAESREYLAANPQLTQLLHDFLTNCLVNKPDDCFQFCNEYFEGFKGGDGAGDTVDGWGYFNCRALILCGPAGSGKHWLARKLVKMHEDKFGLVLEHTSRAPRDMEQDGTHYIFTQRAQIEIAQAGGETLAVSERAGELFGVMMSRVDSIASTRRVPIILCEVQHLNSIRKSLAGRYHPRCLNLRPSLEQAEKRLRGDGDVSEEIVTDLLARRTATEEKLSTFAQGVFDFEVEVEYDEEDTSCFASKSLDAVVGWCLSSDWEVPDDSDLSKAATKIQGQARRKRDAKRAAKLKKEREGGGGEAAGAEAPGGAGAEEGKTE
mmetsp:Transcript_10785/g.25850  ORF Transcript_10785/g.25850 Transcript_10785/m.25850 type:complete len:339 (+) Transcript_10785:149-1165(+)